MTLEAVSWLPTVLTTTEHTGYPFGFNLAWPSGHTFQKGVRLLLFWILLWILRLQDATIFKGRCQFCKECPLFHNMFTWVCKSTQTTCVQGLRAAYTQAYANYLETKGEQRRMSVNVSLSGHLPEILTLHRWPDKPLFCALIKLSIRDVLYLESSAQNAVLQQGSFLFNSHLMALWDTHRYIINSDRSISTLAQRHHPTLSHFGLLCWWISTVVPGIYCLRSAQKRITPNDSTLMHRKAAEHCK